MSNGDLIKISDVLNKDDLELVNRIRDSAIESIQAEINMSSNEFSAAMIIALISSISCITFLNMLGHEPDKSVNKNILESIYLSMKKTLEIHKVI